jgi:hypothetical protein
MEPRRGAVDHSEGVKDAHRAVARAVRRHPPPGLGQRQDLRKIFRDVSPSVVVIRAKGQEITTTGTTRFGETGSGVR